MGEPVDVGRFAFRFECQSGCTECCKQPGEVWLTLADRDRIAAWLGLEPEAFQRQFCVDDEEGLRLAIPSSDSCLFLQEDGCSIHDVKPLQCRAFPFWPENVGSSHAWRALRKFCPGVGEGEILPVEQIRPVAQDCADAFPDHL